LLGIITFFLGNFDWIHQVSRVAEAYPNQIDESKMKDPYPTLLLCGGIVDGEENGYFSRAAITQ
jgi:hypothetical protein